METGLGFFCSSGASAAAISSAKGAASTPPGGLSTSSTSAGASGATVFAAGASVWVFSCSVGAMTPRVGGRRRMAPRFGAKASLPGFVRSGSFAGGADTVSVGASAASVCSA